MTTNFNINYTSQNRATFDLVKLPNVSFTSTKFTLPSIKLPPAEASSPKFLHTEPGDKIKFDEFSLTFIVVEDLSNWNEIYQWLIDNGAPRDYRQYKHDSRFSDGVLQLYSSKRNPILKYKFYNMHPIELSGIDFDESDEDFIIRKSEITFAYTHYEIYS